jgi:hypothetical protein
MTGTNLIVNERNQRRHDNCHTISDDGRQLIAQRFATARRQHDENVVFS